MIRARRFLVTAAALFLLAGAGIVARGDSPAAEAMMTLSRALQDLTESLRNGDAPTARLHAKALAHATNVPESVRPLINSDLSGEFERLRDELRALGTDLGQLAASGKSDRMEPLVQDLRNTCVSCHVKFRPNNDRRGLHPATGNTISGQVRIDVASEEHKEDASNVVVFLESTERPAAIRSSGRRRAISQRNHEFYPKVLAVTTGTTVDFPNDDTIFHNAFSLSKSNPFDLGIYKRGTSKSVTLEQAGLVKVYCNIHPRMLANVLVLNEPHFAVTDRKGLFVIPGVPDGEYALRTWHDFGEETRRLVTISGRQLHQLDIDIAEDRKAIQHRNKFGKSYSSKY